MRQTQHGELTCLGSSRIRSAIPCSRRSRSSWMYRCSSRTSILQDSDVDGRIGARIERSSTTDVVSRENRCFRQRYDQWCGKFHKKHQGRPGRVSRKLLRRKKSYQFPRRTSATGTRYRCKPKVLEPSSATELTSTKHGLSASSTLDSISIHVNTHHHHIASSWLKALEELTARRTSGWSSQPPKR